MKSSGLLSILPIFTCLGFEVSQPASARDFVSIEAFPKTPRKPADEKPRRMELVGGEGRGSRERSVAVTTGVLTERARPPPRPRRGRGLDSPA